MIVTKTAYSLFKAVQIFAMCNIVAISRHLMKLPLAAKILDEGALSDSSFFFV